MTHPGQVLNRAAQDLPRDEYDFLVIGGGLLGVACAYFLREFAPGKSVLLVEAGGIPSEEGATHIAPALLPGCFDAELEEQTRARWLATLLDKLEHADRGRGPAGAALRRRVGFLQLAGNTDAGNPSPGTVPFSVWRERQPESVQHNVAALFGFADDAPVRFDPAGGYGSAEALALRLGHAAVRAGMDLLLNTRAAFAGADEWLLDRLEANNRMQVESVRQTRVRARTVVVACGADGARLIADGLNESSPFAGRCYLQYPRFENDKELRRDARGVVALPVVAAHGFAIRPHGDGALLLPAAPLPPDSDGYVPTGGQLHGVSVGLRRELLDRLLLALDTLPALSRPSLNLGKTPANVRGAWEALTPSGRPEFWHLPDTKVWQLAAGGGLHAFPLGVAKACELAHRLSATAAPLPWQRQHDADKPSD